jgi:transposase, IS30 family
VVIGTAASGGRRNTLIDRVVRVAVGDGRPGVPRSVERRFWREFRAGLGLTDAAAAVGVSRARADRWYRDGGGMPCVSLTEPTGRFLSLEEREEIAVGLAAGESLRAIAGRLGRSPSTISRELRRNCPRHPDGRLRRGRYRAYSAHRKAEERARRPKTAKLAAYPPLREYVQAKLSGPQRWSPEQIARRLPLEFPDDGRMRVCHETIYQSIYVQGRGALRRELARCLRTGRALRKPQRRPAERRGRIKDMVLISERPAEVADRSVPGHWEGDLIVGHNNASAIGTLVERSTRFVLLLHLTDQSAATVRDAIAGTITTLPAALRRSLTWDQGHELAEHVQLRLATDMDVYFCDPHSPWQRGSNENTNGLLRQYFPKGTDLAVHTPADLADVAAALNGRPRKTLDWRTPAEALNELLSAS